MADSLIEWFQASISARQHCSAFHRGQHMSCESGGFDIFRQPIRGIFDQPPNRIAPCFEIFDDQAARCRLAVAHFKREISNRASEVEVGCFEQQPITFQHRKQPLDRIICFRLRATLDVSRYRAHALRALALRDPIERRFQHSRLEQCLVFLQHCDQQVLFARKEVIEASAVSVRFFENLSDTRRDIALLEEKISRGFDNPLPSSSLRFKLRAIALSGFC